MEALGLEGVHLVANDLPIAGEPYRSFLPGLTAVEIEDSGHYMPEDQPDRVGEEVAKWVQRQIDSA